MSIKHEIQALVMSFEKLENEVLVPEGDYSSSALNSQEIFDRLPPQTQALVEEVVEEARTTLLQQGDESLELNSRARRTLAKEGGRVVYQTDQDDPYRMVGNVTIGGVTLDLSDPPLQSHDE
ncbi:hypothetical protein [Paludibacterium denitrificans]|uniref:Uncharacterized protein n=1 Tax=Paludibacterium denitrificans TaxID=2675226 RepID=A0A844GI85_9NEIS|nr:hypothetical protein [Paludibacterium denitrificans]MTD34185.1 hypothetical protein [Paludibacterium denitrificans]MTD34253.1 hypothetical protein [Paludibacterium denitrificans]